MDLTADAFITFRPSSSFQDALARAARAFGIELDYWDIFGRRHYATEETLVALLRSRGVDVSSRESIDRCFEARLWDEWSRPLPPTLVTLAGESQEEPPDPIPVRLPERLSGASAELTFEWERGGTLVQALPLQSQAPVSRADLRGTMFCCWTIPIPAHAPLGYHNVTLRVTDPEAVTARMRLIVCPRRAWLPPELERRKTAGIAIGLYGLRSRRNWGCGDFTDLREFTGWVANRLEGSFVALNPLHSINNRIPYNTSPYSPNSIFYKNPLYLDIERVEEFRNSPWAQKILAGRKVQEEIESLRGAEFVEYERIYRLKMRFLKLLFRGFQRDLAAGTPRAAEFHKWCGSEGGLLERFALYCALDEILHRQNRNIWVWQEWPEPYQDPESPQTRQFAGEHPRLVMFYKYVQWLVHLQLLEAHEHARAQGMAIGLYHDLALATDRCGSDLWAQRRYFVAGCRVGSPPDDFAPDGQDWGFPPPDTDRHREDGYRLVIDSIRLNSRYGGALRIDHVMRFFRLYWIPDGAGAAHGTYVNDHYKDFVRILALESTRSKFLLVGEDLGTVPPLVRDTLSRYGILSYRLFYFEKHPDGGFRLPAEYPKEALVSTTTHDLPTLAGFWINRDIEARRAAGILPDEASYRAQLAARAVEKQRMLDVLHRLGLLPASYPRRADDIPEMTGELHNAIFGFLASTPSLLLAVNQEDLTKETEQQNLPGTTARYPNWRRKMRFSLEDLEELETARNFTAMARNWLRQSLRSKVIS